MDGVGMDESNLKAKEAAARRSVDQFRTRVREISQCCADVGHPVRDVVHTGPAPRDKPADRRVRASRSEQLHAAITNEDRRSLHALFSKLVAMLEATAEQ